MFLVQSTFDPTGLYEILLTTTCKHQAFEDSIVLLHTSDYNHI